MESTDLFKTLKALEAEYFERIQNTDGKWKAHWQDELNAVQRAIWALKS
jgi:hypothetical protein